MAEITHLTCAHCGSDNAVNNREHEGPLEWTSGDTLQFTCNHCQVSYPLLSPTITRQGVEDSKRRLLDEVLSAILEPLIPPAVSQYELAIRRAWDRARIAGLKIIGRDPVQ